jgi:ADP-heptose:LPS heptosyltransferase
MKPPLHVLGMHGLGDCLHQRAVVRQMMKTHDITLETSWPALYHDLIAEGLKVARCNVSLRTQTKNSRRESEAAKFVSRHPLTRAGMRISYTGQQTLATESKTVLECMCNVTGVSYADADYRLPVPLAWQEALYKVLGPSPAPFSRKPWMLYRPLVARPEWRGSIARNADPSGYADLYNSIRDKFFVVSVADLGGGAEQIVGPDAQADLTFHNGELVIEELVALAKQSALVFTSSGFAAILGPAVGTPTISIGGGYEDYRCHDSGARFAPYLSIGPKVGCTCWISSCRGPCDKTLDMDAAREAVSKFVETTCAAS